VVKEEAANPELWDFGFHETVFSCSSYGGGWKRHSHQLRILAPVDISASASRSSHRNKGKVSKKKLFIQAIATNSPAEHTYNAAVKDVADAMIALLNEQLIKNWQFDGFDPYWHNETSVKKAHAAFRKRIAAQRKADTQQQKMEEKIKAKAAQTDSDAPPPEPRTGAGRTPGARPGIYKGVQMRSQLEIRFVSELDERGIRWIYEGEALGDAGYLVDFYLPDLGVWAEVKGRFEARDRQVLPQVAQTLKVRNQRLLVYTGSGPCVVVNPSGFREFDRKIFWTELAR